MEGEDGQGESTQGYHRTLLTNPTNTRNKAVSFQFSKVFNILVDNFMGGIETCNM